MSVLDNYKNIKKKIAEMTPGRGGLPPIGSGPTIPTTGPEEPTPTIPVPKDTTIAAPSWQDRQLPGNTLMSPKGGSGGIGSRTFTNQQPAAETTLPPEKHVYDPATDPDWANPDYRIGQQSGRSADPLGLLDHRTGEKVVESNISLPTAKVEGANPMEAVIDSNISVPAPTEEGVSTSGTEAESLLDEQVLADAKGESTEVAAARDRLDREKVLRMDQARRKAHEAAVRAGYRPGTAQYDQMMRNAVDGANRANISAENELNAFARETRMGVRDQLAAIGDRDYGRGRNTRADRLEDISLLMKNIPTDAGRELLAVSNFMGKDFETIVGTLFNEDGTWIQDPTKLELAKKSFNAAIDTMETDPNTRLPWASPEAKEEYKNLTWSQMQENIFNPITTEGTTQDEKKVVEDRLQGYVDSGDYSNMMSGDYNQMTETQKEAVHKASLDVDGSDKLSTPWSGTGASRPSMTNSEAKEAYMKENPDYTVGKIVQHEGEYYIISNITTRDAESEAVAYGLGGLQGRKKVSVMAEPINGGKAIEVDASDRYDDD